MSSSTENRIPTETFLLPGQGFAIGLSERAGGLPKHGLPPRLPAPSNGNVLDQAAALEGDPCSGWQLGRCEVIRRLSPGSAKRLLALRHDLLEGRDVVDLRQLDVGEGDGPAIEAWAAEAMRLSHPNLARVHDCELTDEGIFWVSERVSGATFAELAPACRVVGKAVPLGLALPAIYDAAQALAAVHERTTHGLVSNHAVAVGFDGVTKLLDAGLFHVLARRASWAEVLAQTGPYLAPEQLISGRMPDPKSDLYSLAVVLYECLTGEPVRRAQSFEERVKLMERGELPPPSTFNVMLPKAVDEVVLRALATDRSRRFERAEEFAEALKRASSAFMWRSDARARFVSELFETRRRREQELTAHLARKRTATAERSLRAAPAASSETTGAPRVSAPVVAEELVVSAPLGPMAPLAGGRTQRREWALGALDPLPMRTKAPTPARRATAGPSTSAVLAPGLAAALGLLVGLAAVVMPWAAAASQLAGRAMPLSRPAPRHEVAFAPKWLPPIVDGELSREVEALASIGPEQPAPLEAPAKRVRPKVARRARGEPPIPPWLRRR